MFNILYCLNIRLGTLIDNNISRNDRLDRDFQGATNAIHDQKRSNRCMKANDTSLEESQLSFIRHETCKEKKMKMTTKATLAAMVFFMATAVPAMAANGMSNDVPGASSIILAGHGHGHGNGGNGGSGSGDRGQSRDGSCEDSVTVNNATLILAGNGNGNGGNGGKGGNGSGDRKRDGSCQSAVTAHNATFILAGNGNGKGGNGGNGTGGKGKKTGECKRS